MRHMGGLGGLAALAAIGALGADDDRERVPSISAEGQIARLLERLEVYKASCPFKVGDVVTPRADSSVKGAGLPHVVADILEKPFYNFSGDFGSNAFGRRVDVRVICFHNGNILPHWCESWEFERYSEPDTVQPGGE